MPLPGSRSFDHPRGSLFPLLLTSLLLFPLLQPRHTRSAHLGVPYKKSFEFVRLGYRTQLDLAPFIPNYFACLRIFRLTNTICRPYQYWSSRKCGYFKRIERDTAIGWRDDRGWGRIVEALLSEVDATV